MRTLYYGGTEMSYAEYDDIKVRMIQLINAIQSLKEHMGPNWQNHVNKHDKEFDELHKKFLAVTKLTGCKHSKKHKKNLRKSRKSKKSRKSRKSRGKKN